jgi:hypothetical protein
MKGRAEFVTISIWSQSFMDKAGHKALEKLHCLQGFDDGEDHEPERNLLGFSDTYFRSSITRREFGCANIILVIEDDIHTVVIL